MPLLRLRLAQVMILLCAFVGPLQAGADASKVSQLPSSMVYFDEAKIYEVNQANQIRLDSIAHETGFSIGQNPRFTLSDVLLFSADFTSVIFVSANRRVNPQFVGGLYQVGDGVLAQTISNRQQLAVYFYNVSGDVREKVVAQLSDSGAFSFLLQSLIPEAHAGELGTSRLATTARQLRDASVNCYVDGVWKEGIYEPYQRYVGQPFANSVQAAGRAIANPRAAYHEVIRKVKSVPQFWRDEVERTRNVGTYLRGVYRQRVSDLHQVTSKDVARTACSFFVPVGAVGKIAESGRLLEATSALSREGAALNAGTRVTSRALEKVASKFRNANVIIRDAGHRATIIPNASVHEGSYAVAFTRTVDLKANQVRERFTLIEGEANAGQIGKLKSIKADAETYRHGHGFNVARINVGANGEVFLESAPGLSSDGDLDAIAEKLRAIGLKPKLR